MVVTVFELLMGALALVSVWLATQPNTEFNHRVSLTVWGAFVLDYGVRLVRAKDKPGYFKANVPDLIAILPWDFLRAARLVRLVRVLRLLRGVEVLWRVGRHLSGIMKTNGLVYLLGVTAVIVVGAGFVVSQIEPGIGTPGDGVWWSLVTATTVGYGDISPKTQEGRLIAALLMLVGIGAIGMITGSIATYFIGARGSAHPTVRHLQQRLDEWDSMSEDERREVVRVLDALAKGQATGSMPTQEVSNQGRSAALAK